MRHVFEAPRGRLVTLRVESAALRENLLGDPAWRDITVYLPEGYDASDADYPLLCYLAGYTSSGLLHAGWRGCGDNLPQRLDRLVRQGAMGPMVAVLPDGFTSLGGSQYINSKATGRWADFLIEDVIPRVEAEFRVRRGRRHRAVTGKSSGGYGAIVHGMLYADHWGAVACHSGDMGFDWVYACDFPRTVALLERHGGVEGFLRHLDEARKISGGEMHALMTLAMAATYDPDPSAPKGIRLPVDLHTCKLDREAWERWLRHDPVRMILRPECVANLRKLSGLFLDCGSRDQYHLQFGARRLVRALEEAGIPHRYEEFDDDHSGIDYRLDVSLPFLYSAVTAT